MQDSLSIECSNCGFVFQNEELNEPIERRKPCPNCGSLDRNARLTHKETLELHEYTKLKAKSPTSEHRHNFNYETQKGDDYWRKEGVWVKKEVVFDRDSDYHEKTIRKDDKIIYHKKEKLSEKHNKSSQHG